ncbi:MAG: hypothetical protein MJ016_07125 [Victivallaceae bacterium]|nr:hypothetical protein [Victivallaceae bacterium]
MHAVQNAFNAGELSPKMRCRYDVEQFSHGFRSGCNFLLTPYGTLERRPGTVFISKAYQPTGRIRLILFKISRDNVYVAEFGDHYIRFFKDNTVVARLDNTIYSAEELAAIDYVQSNDVMFLAHPDHPVMELRRTSATNFELRQMPIGFPPVKDINTDESSTITPSARSGTITLTASKSIFQAGHVNGYFEIDNIRTGAELDITLTGSTSSYLSSDKGIRGYWSLVTHGTWRAKVFIERSENNGPWETYRSFSGDNDNNVESSGTEDGENVKFRIRVKDYVQAGESAENRKLHIVLTNSDTLIPGAVQILSVSGGTSARAKVVKTLGGTAATSEWSEGSWSSKNGFPRSISFFEERLVLGGTKGQPNTLWLSKTNNWNDFAYGAADDSALSITLASDTANEIRWLCPQSVLFIGTSDSEWILSGGDFGNVALTASRGRRLPTGPPTSTASSPAMPFSMSRRAAAKSGNWLFPTNAGALFRPIAPSWPSTSRKAASSKPGSFSSRTPCYGVSSPTGRSPHSLMRFRRAFSAGNASKLPAAPSRASPPCRSPDATRIPSFLPSGATEKFLSKCSLPATTTALKTPVSPIPPSSSAVRPRTTLSAA